MRIKYPFIVALVLVATPELSTAGFEGIVSVIQPLGLSDSGPILRVVHYIGYSVDPASRQWILFTTQPNLVWCDGKGQDRNEASQNGIQFRDASNTPSDTLQIAVDLVSFPGSGGKASQADHELLTTILWCGLMNARQIWPKIHYVHYRFEGDPQFAPYDGVYALERVPDVQEPVGLNDWGPQALRDSCSPKKP